MANALASRGVSSSSSSINNSQINHSHDRSHHHQHHHHHQCQHNQHWLAQRLMTAAAASNYYSSQIGYDRDRLLLANNCDLSESGILAITCSICFGILRRPVQLPCDYSQESTIAHIFCKLCIEKWFQQSRTCPSCRKQIPANFTPTPLTNEFSKSIERLELRCYFQYRGCEVVTCLSAMESHENKCQFRPACCPFSGCSLLLQRNELAGHVKCCSFSNSIFWSSWMPSRRLDPPPVVNSVKKKWLNAPSSVADLVILPNNSTAVICLRGQILNLANVPSNSAPLQWRSRVQLPSGVSGLCHAAFDATTGRIYFTVCPLNLGIFWVDFSSIEAAAVSGCEAADAAKCPAVQLRCLVRGGRNGTNNDTKSSSSSSSRIKGQPAKPVQFLGLAALQQLQVLACCQREPSMIGLWSATKADGDNESSQLLGEVLLVDDLPWQPFLPFRCAAYVSSPTAAQQQQQKQNTLDWHITLAVDDYKNSRLHLFGVVAHQTMTITTNNSPSHRGVDNNASSTSVALKFETKFERVLAALGSQKGAVRSPDGLHFDPDGRLIVADSGNYRIQIFSAISGIQSLWDLDFSSSPSTLPLALSWQYGAGIGNRPDISSSYKGGCRWRCIWASSYLSASLGRYADDLPDWCSARFSAVVAPLDPHTQRPFILAGLWEDEDVVCFQ